ncbi:hypothetical protein HETIRDRAFT_173803 [Heterobasidion irregulare TC 32-1]|uniref:DUF6533 domain-containing protein n=1 Tax=Heterobasidion irregulare (strain TC 32-1) TaxID=747525 RepID=W4JVH4_HETIT|nr:uncharacterized protein HETIRDRAFT_173803 [Heterobasidion irregulare TC 32-1]ETW77542.1 hypothetical protein HETIRDRAFT_173803 [Heterobasidion irregulare TC 32-1]
MMILIQDWLVLFGEEVDLVWNSQWSIPKLLYIINRYAPFVDVTLDLYHSLSKSISPEVPSPSEVQCDG